MDDELAKKLILADTREDEGLFLGDSESQDAMTETSTSDLVSAESAIEEMLAVESVGGEATEKTLVSI